MKFRFCSFVGIVFSILLMLLSNSIYANAADKSFLIQVVYFEPSNSKRFKKMKPKIEKSILDSQRIFGLGLQAHGFGFKTFKYEKDEKGKLVIHVVKGKHKVMHYKDKTHNRVLSEVPREFQFFGGAPGKNKDKIVVFVVGGVSVVESSRAGFGYNFQNGRYGGLCFIAGNRISSMLVGHEIGHTFGLFHRNSCNGCLMNASRNMGDVLKPEQARWLDKSYFFNDKKSNRVYPNIRDENYVMRKFGNSLQFQLGISSETGLHQIRVHKWRFGPTFLRKYYNGEKKTILFINVNKNNIPKEGFYVTVMNTDGAMASKVIKIKGTPDVNDLDDWDNDDQGNNDSVPHSVDPVHKITLTWAQLKYNLF